VSWWDFAKLAGSGISRVEDAVGSGIAEEFGGRLFLVYFHSKISYHN
jgi:hypothetical protein